MKRHILAYGLLVSLSAFTFMACDDDSQELNPVQQEVIAPTLSKYEPVVLGPSDTLKTAEADFNVAVGDYKFKLAGIYADNEEDLSDASTLQLFNIDEQSGQISIVSTNAKKVSELALGKYYFSLALSHMGGVAVYDSIASIEIIDLPFTVAYGSTPYELSFGTLGEFSTVTVNSEDEDLVVEKYELTASPEGISINETTGALSKTTTNLAAGDYDLSVKVYTNKGFKDFVELVHINVGEKPELHYTQEGNQVTMINIAPEVGFTVELTGNTEDIGTGLVYALKNVDLEGLSIDTNTGAITLAENSNPVEGIYPVSINVSNESGLNVDYLNLFNVKVTIPTETPQLFYAQAGTQFTNVTVSSWSGFTVAVDGPSEELGTGLVYSFKDTDVAGLSIDANTGAITLAEDSNLAEGNYIVSISVTNDEGKVVDYPEMFTIDVVNAWEQIALDELDVSGYAEKEARPVDDQYPYYETTKLNASAVEFISYKHKPDAGTGFLAYGFGINLGKELEMDTPLLRELAMDGTFRKMKVSFGETSVGKIQTDAVKRRFYFGYNRSELIDNSNFVDAEWNLLIDENSEKWATNNFKTDFKTIETEFEVDDPAQEKLYLQWRITSTQPATGYTRAYFNAIKIEVMKKTVPDFK
ncbi:MAG: hypothetical protein ACEPOZ_20390 [Marinifilaceae bacterium]